MHGTEHLQARRKHDNRQGSPKRARSREGAHGTSSPSERCNRNVRGSATSITYNAPRAPRWELTCGSHQERLQIRYRLCAQRIQHCAAGREDVRHPIRRTIPLERRAPFAAADVDFDARLFEPLQLLDEASRTLLEAGVLEHAEHPVVKCHGRSRAFRLIADMGDKLADFQLK